MKLKIIRLIEDREKNSDGTVSRYGVEREVISATKIIVGYEALERERAYRLDVRGRRQKISLTGRG